MHQLGTSITEPNDEWAFSLFCQTLTVCLVLGPEGWVGSVPRFEDGTNPFLCLVVWVEFILFFVWLEGLEKRDAVQL